VTDESSAGELTDLGRDRDMMMVLEGRATTTRSVATSTGQAWILTNAFGMYVLVRVFGVHHLEGIACTPTASYLDIELCACAWLSTQTVRHVCGRSKGRARWYERSNGISWSHAKAIVRCEVVISCIEDCCLPCLPRCVWNADERVRGTPSCEGWKKQDVEFCWSHTTADAVCAECLADSERFEKH